MSTSAQTDLNFGSLVGYSTSSAPGNNPMGLFQLGWAPDYPDPTDYVTPMYVPDSTYTYSDAVMEQLTNVTQGFDNPGCHSATDYGYWAVQANNHAIQENCQGAAYMAMSAAMTAAAGSTDTSARNILYWQAESIANGLALYVYWGQSNIVESCASYLNVNSFNSNVTIGGGTDNTWYSVVYTATGNGASD
jgi:peptide/nickel transport system substrate-binding protein